MNKPLLFLLLFICKITPIYPMKSMRKHIMKKVGYLSYHFSKKYKKERKIEAFYKKMADLSDDTNQLVASLVTANYIPKEGTIKNFAQKSLQFTHFFYNQYPLFLQDARFCKQQEEILNNSATKIAGIQKDFTAYKQKKSNFLESEYKMRIDNVDSSIKKLQLKLYALQSTYKQLKSHDENIVETSPPQPSHLFQQHKATLEERFKKNKDQGIAYINQLISTQKYRLLLQIMRVKLFEIISHLYEDDLLKVQEYRLVKYAINSYLIFPKIEECLPYTERPHLLYKINELSKKIDQKFLKNIILSVGLFYNIEEQAEPVSTPTIQSLIHILKETYNIAKQDISKSDYTLALEEIINHSQELISLQKYLKPA